MNVWDYRACVWDYRESTWTLDGDLVGYDVEATDGPIGRIERVANDAFGAYVVVDIVGWSVGGKRLVPAGAISSLDHPSRRVHVALTQEQLTVAPCYVEDEWNDDARVQHGEAAPTEELLHQGLAIVSPACSRQASATVCEDGAESQVARRLRRILAALSSWIPKLPTATTRNPAYHHQSS
jgi:hypothetical protein